MSSSEQRAAVSDERITWTQFITLMFNWHVDRVKIEYLMDESGIRVYFCEGRIEQIWYFKDKP